MRAKCGVLVGAMVWAAGAVAGDGYLDPGFGALGRAIVPQSTAGEYRGDGATAVVVQPHGRLVLAGFVPRLDESGNEEVHLRLVRVLDDGAADLSFGSGGVVDLLFDYVSPFANLTASTLWPVRLVRAADGGFFVSASVQDGAGNFGVAVVKLDAAGNRVEGFGTLGASTAMRPASGRYVVTGMGLSGGALLLGGIYTADYDASPSAGTIRAVAIDTSSGALLASYTAGAETGDRAYDAAVDGNRLVIAGSSGAHCEVLRLVYAGATLASDTGFGGGSGRVAVIPAAYNTLGACRSVAVQGDGRIVYAGDTGDGGTHHRTMVGRLLADGSADAGFNAGAPAVSYYESSTDNAYNYVFGLALQSDGRVLLAGAGTPAPAASDRMNLDMGVLRYNANGSLDASFFGDTPGSNTATTMIGFEPLAGAASTDVAYAIALTAGRPVVVGGASSFGFASNPWVMARLQSDLIFVNRFE